MVVTEFIDERPDVTDVEIIHNSSRVASMLHKYVVECKDFLDQRR